MEYRDERDALRGRVENLEQDLAGARAELAQRGDAMGAARIEELERRSAEARRLLDEESTTSSRRCEASRTAPPLPASCPREGPPAGEWLASSSSGWPRSRRGLPS